MSDIEKAYFSHVYEIAKSVNERPRDPELTDEEHLLALAACGFSVGFEEGLAIGLLAPEAADRWLRHLFTAIHDSDPEYTAQSILENNSDLIEGVGLRSGGQS